MTQQKLWGRRIIVEEDLPIIKKVNEKQMREFIDDDFDNKNKGKKSFTTRIKKTCGIIKYSVKYLLKQNLIGAKQIWPTIKRKFHEGRKLPGIRYRQIRNFSPKETYKNFDIKKFYNEKVLTSRNPLIKFTIKNINKVKAHIDAKRAMGI